MWGHPVPVLGAISPFLEPFRGRLSPNIDNVSEKLTLRYPHEGPWVGRPVRHRHSPVERVKACIDYPEGARQLGTSKCFNPVPEIDEKVDRIEVNFDRCQLSASPSANFTGKPCAGCLAEQNLEWCGRYCTNIMMLYITEDKGGKE